ncbi:MAG: PqqD family protein [Pyrinomonadaceae bacterium]
MEQKPLARKTGLVTQEMPDELLIYDMGSKKAHCLNSTAAFVWNSCDGNTSIDDIASSLERMTGKSVQKDIVVLALEELSKNNLLDGEDIGLPSGMSRREVLRRVGIAAAVAIPVVASLAVPSNVMAATSGVAPGGPCVDPVDCQSGACLGSPGTCL